MQSLEASD